jgi:hypothetical protein
MYKMQFLFACVYISCHVVHCFVFSVKCEKMSTEEDLSYQEYCVRWSGK